jgi:hypothetical protein
MNRNTYSGSPAAKTACPNRDPKFPFRHSKTARVNLRPLPQEAAEELCTSSALIRAVIFLLLNAPLSVTPWLQPGVLRPQTFPAVSTAYLLRWASSYDIADFLNSNTHFTPDFMRFSEIFDFDFEPKTASPTLN